MPKKPYKGLVFFYNAVVIFLLLTIWVTRASLHLMTVLIMFLIVPIGLYYVIALINSLFDFPIAIKDRRLLFLYRLLALYCIAITGLFFFSMVISISSVVEFFFTLALLPLPGYLLYRHWLKSKLKIQKYRRLATTLTKMFTKQKMAAKAKADDVVLEPEIVELAEVKPVDVAEQLGTAINSAIETIKDEYLTQTDEETLKDSQADEGEVYPEVADLDRRKFLKIIGASSLGFAVLSLIMPQKASAAFFGSVPGPGTVALKDSDGNQIDPAEKSPTDGYKISEIDDDSSPSYYGFVDKDGQWYISKENVDGSYRYVKGTSGFSTNWSNRVSLTYNYFDIVFS